MTWKPIVGIGYTAAQFAAYVDNLRWTSWRPQFCVLHHSGLPTLGEWKSGYPIGQRLQNLVHYYRDIMGWSAGPHLFVADDLIWCFTPLTAPGVHSPSWNLVSIGVEAVGDYRPGYDNWSADPGLKVAENTIAALASLHHVLGIAPETMKLHLEDPLTSHKECPGSQVGKSEIIARVRAALNARLTGHAGEHDPAALRS